MGKIYGQATNVLVWLGEDFRGDVKQSFASLEELSKLDKSHVFHVPYDFMKSSEVKALGLQSWSEERWLSLALLLSRQWFMRQWCSQEVLLARNTNKSTSCNVYLLCGDEMLSWSVVRPAYDTLSRHNILQPLESLAYDTAQAHGLKATDRTTAVITGLWSLDILADLLTLRMNLTESLFGDLAGLPSDTLISRTLIDLLLWLTGRKLASDPRDQIYALLGVAQKISVCLRIPWHDMAPDYNETPENVFTKLSGQIIEESQ